jgi:hypothetical protein
MYLNLRKKAINTKSVQGGVRKVHNQAPDDYSPDTLIQRSLCRRSIRGILIGFCVQLSLPAPAPVVEQAYTARVLLLSQLMLIRCKLLIAMLTL